MTAWSIPTALRGLSRIGALALLAVVAVAFTCPASAQGDDPAVRVTLDTSQVADREALVQWGQSARDEIIAWYPRIRNLLATEGFDPPTEVTLVIRDQDNGVGHTAGTTITIMSGWIERRPDDMGLVIHELTHVIQNYPRTPGWVTEGIADYVRWVIYEGLTLEQLHCPDEAHGYRRGYRVTAGFLFWLEAGAAPGIVSRLNTAARNRAYSDELFEQATGQTLEALWDAYRAERHGHEQRAND